MRYSLLLPMKRSPSTMSITLWVIGGLLAAYVVGGVIFYFDLNGGSFFIGHVPEPVLDFVSSIYAPVFVLLWSIWPDLFPFLR